MGAPQKGGPGAAGGFVLLGIGKVPGPFLTHRVDGVTLWTFFPFFFNQTEGRRVYILKSMKYRKI